MQYNSRFLSLFSISTIYRDISILFMKEAFNASMRTLCDLQLHLEKSGHKACRDLTRSDCKISPPGFQHQCSVSQWKAYLAKPNTYGTGYDVRPWIHNYCLKQKNQLNSLIVYNSYHLHSCLILNIKFNNYNVYEQNEI